MKKIVFCFLCITFFFVYGSFRLCVFAEEKETENDLTDFEITEQLIRYLGTEESVVIPESVTEISEYAFSRNKFIKYVKIPEGITRINRYTFEYCTSLETVELPESITSIEEGAFYQCTNLKNISLGNAVHDIGFYAFEGCKNLEDINLECPGFDIGYRAFHGTKWLEKKAKENPLVIIDGTLIDGSTCKGKVIIPDTVTLIGDGAFEQAEITSVVIPDPVEQIGYRAFACSDLTTVRMSDSVQTIAEEAFEKCTALKNIRISNSLQRLTWNVFRSCYSLRKITLPESVEIIDCLAFADCKKLKYLTISKRLCIYTNYDNDQYTNSFWYTNSKSKPTIYTLDLDGFSFVIDSAKKRGIPLEKLKLQAEQVTLQKGEVYELRMNSYADCESWSSRDPSVASVNDYGKITAKKRGTTIITAILYGEKFECKVIVK